MTTAESKAILTNKAHQIADGESFLNVLPVPPGQGIPIITTGILKTKLYS